MSKERLDVALAAQGLFPSREQAQRAILAGEVKVNDATVTKAGFAFDALKDRLSVKIKERFASRGGLKLEKALASFGVDPSGRVALDIGASTGGFTDCLLKAGASRVFAIDVGYGQLAWELRNDPRVVVLERTNIRHMTPEKFSPFVGSEPWPSLAVIDVSFISLRKVLPAIDCLLLEKNENIEIVSLVKPQFEAGREKIGKHGVVRDPAVHQGVLEAVRDAAFVLGWSLAAATYSPVTGPEGNIEFLIHLKKTVGGPEKDRDPIDLVALVEEAHRELHGKADRHRL